jgi:hypothetical protein
MGAMLMLGALTASLAVLASLVLPGVIAGGISLGMMGLLLMQASRGHLALGRLPQVLLNGSANAGDTLMLAALLESAVAAAALFEVSVRIFEQRDLRLKSE